MKLHATLHHDDNIVNNASIKQEIAAIKTHFAVKSDLIKWTVGVGATSVVTIVSMLAILDARVTHLDTRLTQEIREVRKEMREDRQAARQESRAELQEMRQEMRQTFEALSNKIDTLK